METALEPTKESVLVRGVSLKLSHNKAEYEGPKIELIEFMPGRIGTDEVGRLLITQNHEVFRATDAELYKSIPQHRKKILVLGE